MLRVGDFSQLARVTVRALRHYDALGLLRPARTDLATGYRYYAVEQLARLGRVLALRDLGFPLAEVRRLADADVPPGELRALLERRRAAAARRADEEAARLARVEARLLQLERLEAGGPGGDAADYPVALKRVPAFAVVAARATVPRVADMRAYRCALYAAVYAHLDRAGVAPGAELALYHHRAYTERRIALEAAVALASPACRSVDRAGADGAGESGAAVGVPTATATGTAAHGVAAVAPPDVGAADVRVREVPGATVASVVHTGALPDVGRAITALYAWLGASGYAAAGPYRELHLFGREQALARVDRVVLELQLPVTRAAVRRAGRAAASRRAAAGP
jgi:DNA-binding transcriptional MerR regulator